MEVETRKRGGADGTPLAAEKRPRGCDEVPVDLAAAGDVNDDVFDWISLDGVTMEEIMEFLDGDGDGEGGGCSSSGGSCSPVKFIENPYSSPLICQSSTSYVTINGNEETCGSSFSDCECSVMASVDVGGAVRCGGAAGERDELCEWFHGGGGVAWGVEEAREGNESGG